MGTISNDLERPVILLVNWCHITDLVSAKGKTKEVYCCDIVVLIVLFWCFWCVKDLQVKSVYWNIVWWGCGSISINWLLFSPLPKLGQLTSIDRENPDFRWHRALRGISATAEFPVYIALRRKRHSLMFHFFSLFDWSMKQSWLRHCLCSWNDYIENDPQYVEYV